MSSPKFYKIIAAGMAALLQIYLLASRRYFPYSPGPVAAWGGAVAALENTVWSQGSAAGTGVTSAVGEQYRWQPARSMVSRTR